ncbi:serine-type D-Ala-D-Ala carboxypeptidase [Enterobacteriaceae endosymbiont of Donacia thalassina]|uniref:serine hydrolase n=1 Tax=Enterobacteriaceae endosymbiont of Donacia thalassina TaxID=2675786 RepID=UPI0014490F60|nr:serine hydrolase [Enterobacteriaceae endosymbiont of Donacia thalassina]QJC37197.1 serine-type D-Ala-D-Ala carboxypeptidase [Enterobacteriaceae endosymbiont of Donacia thalassina]
MKIYKKNNKFLNKILKIITTIFVVYSTIVYANENIFNIISQPTIDVKSYILIDYNTGIILTEKNSNETQKPASLAKIMTSYVIGKALSKGKIHRNDIVIVSKNAWSTGNIEFNGSSLMFLKIGDHISVQNLIKGIILQSGNDACVAMAEYISGTQKNFVNLMNFYAKKIGLKNTCFKNVHGLDENGQYTSAKDIAIMGKSLIRDFPYEYSIYKEKKFTFNNISQKNRNLLLWDKTLNVDGIKTGHTENAGYNIIASAIKNNMRLIVVILGDKTEQDRKKNSKKLLNWGFETFRTINPIKKYQKIASIPVLYGKHSHIRIGIKNNVFLTIIKNQEKRIKILYHIKNNKIFAPIYRNQVLGNLTFIINNHIIGRYPLVALENIPKGNIFICLLDYIRLLLSKWIHQ